MTTENMLSVVLEFSSANDMLDDCIGEGMMVDSLSSCIEWMYEKILEEDSLDNEEEGVIALMQHLDEDYYECKTYIEKGKYLVYTDDSLEEAMYNFYKSLYDDIEMPNIPTNMQSYIDIDAWIKDKIREEGSDILASYDGNTIEKIVNGSYYYLFKQ